MPPLSFVQEYARKAHESLFDITITGVHRPRIAHIQEVADLVWAAGGTDEEVIAAWLHDIVEDTPTTLDDISKLFGNAVADIVEVLTDLDHFVKLPLLERKQKQADRIRIAPIGIRKIKIADQTSNIKFLAIDPTVSMTVDECRDYIKGAKIIVDACRGSSSLLENLFDQAYERGVKRYNH